IRYLQSGLGWQGTECDQCLRHIDRWETMAPNLDGPPGRGERDDGAVVDASQHLRPHMRGSNQRCYYENSGYFNFGYWPRGRSRSGRRAKRSSIGWSRESPTEQAGFWTWLAVRRATMFHEARGAISSCPMHLIQWGQMIIASSSIIPSPITSTV